MPRRISNNAVAVLLGLAAALCLSTQDLFVKLLSADVHILQILFARSVFAFGAVLLWVSFLGGGWSQLAIARPRLVAMRIVCNTVAWFCYYLSLPHLSLPVYTAIGFTVFLFSVMLSGPILKEPLTWREWSATAAGLLGVALISNPAAGSGINFYAVALLLFGALMWALSIVTTRALGVVMSAAGIMFYSNLGLLLVGAVSAPAVWTPLPPEAWLMLLCTGVLSFLGQNMMITAVQFARIAVVTPTQYTMLLWATLYGWLLWRELPDGAVIAGAALIIGGCLLALRRRRP